jgi:GMP synthase (glutamine-hydrolysing)
MKPFLILQLRPLDGACENELQAILKYGGLKSNEYRQIRMEREGVPELNLSDYSGIIIGGGPSNISDPEENKSPAQKKYEKDLIKLYNRVFELDFPLLGTCYGVGSISDYLGCEVSREKYSESPGAVDLLLTPEAQNDPITKGLPQTFRAFTGHKESCQKLPPGAVLLAKSKACPYQMFRFKKNIYTVQFHPELDFEGLVVRIGIYKHEGYFNPEDAQKLIDENRNEKIVVPEMILKRFVERYAFT